MRQRLLFLLNALLALLLLGVATASSQAPQATLSAPFTYQGRLNDAGQPANGRYDFQFTLYTAETGGSQVDPVVKRFNVSVVNGLFAISLDFGAVFDDTPLYLEIGVKPAGSADAYTPLLPRQALGATPYAIYSHSAGALRGRSVANTAPGVGQALIWDGAVWVPQTPPGVQKRTVIVSPVGDGAANGAALRAALADVANASSVTSFLLKLEPGVYDVGPNGLAMKSYVDIEGSGEGLTKITAGGSDANDVATVFGASNAELRLLRIENRGGAANAKAIINTNASPRLTQVTITASGADNVVAISNNDRSAPILTNTTVSASQGGFTVGVFNILSSPTIQNSTISATGAKSRALVNLGGTVTARDSQLQADDYIVFSAIQNGVAPVTRIANSQLSGGKISVATCAGVYDENYTFYANTCPS